ncbi:glycosyltransferase family 4 protein [Thermogladius sp. 4427co]|uniref:glycosyltransferase family 4 protein n=1 Tax=Thermogladius sp. 4427co TaxID=3450718 RepID=UPI003F7A3308
MANRATIAVVTEPLTPFSGGAIRALKSIEAYRKSFNILIYELVRTKSDPTSSRDRDVVKVYSSPVLRALFKLRLEFLLGLTPNSISKRMVRIVGDASKTEVGAVVSLHERLEFLRLGSILRDEYEAKSAALLQLPVFIRDRRRREEIVRAYDKWYSALYPGSVKELAGRARTRLELAVSSSRSVARLLRSYDLLISVSRSIGYEMGPEWESRIHALDPGVGLDEVDLGLIKTVRERGVKEDFIVFGGRIDALKGFIEGLEVFKAITRSYRDIKLVATGLVNASLRDRIMRYARRIGLEGKLVLPGAVPRVERFRYIANARLVIYPSHMDSYSYAVLEALYLGTPVVAYDIPALRFNYEGAEGLVLVREGDVEGLATEALNILGSKDIKVSPPRKVKKWDEIVREEISLIERLVEG